MGLYLSEIVPLMVCKGKPLPGNEAKIFGYLFDRPQQPRAARHPPFSECKHAPIGQRIACVDGLTGFPEAINAIFPQAEVQLCDHL